MAHFYDPLYGVVPPVASDPPGGGPADTRDHQTAKYIVGNAIAGDTLDVCDFLDPGDGSGVQAALTAAAAVPGDVYVRPGRYDLTLPGAPALPFTTGWAQTVRGPEFNNNPFAIFFGATVGAATFVVGDTRNVFEFAFGPGGVSFVNTWNLEFEVSAATANTTGTVLINTPIGEIRNCRVVLPGETSLLETLSTVLLAKNVLNCVVEPSNPDGDYANGYDGGVTLTACIAAVACENFFYGTDVGIAVGSDENVGRTGIVANNAVLAAVFCIFCDGQDGSTRMAATGNTMENVSNRDGAVMLYVSNQSDVVASGNVMRCANGYGVYVELSGSVALSANDINEEGFSSAIGIFAEDGPTSGRNLNVAGNRIFGGSSAIVAAPGMVITGNRIVGASIGVEIPATLETDGCVVTGNTFHVGGGTGVEAGGYNAAINGNVFTVAAGTGVDVVATAFRTLIVGNTISGGTAIADVGTGTVTGNNIT